jgi:hypothetical protein
MSERVQPTVHLAVSAGFVLRVTCCVHYYPNIYIRGGELSLFFSSRFCGANTFTFLIVEEGRSGQIECGGVDFDQIRESTF